MQDFSAGLAGLGIDDAHECAEKLSMNAGIQQVPRAAIVALVAYM